MIKLAADAFGMLALRSVVDANTQILTVTPHGVTYELVEAGTGRVLLQSRDVWSQTEFPTVTLGAS